jgi:hypothetical protein
VAVSREQAWSSPISTKARGCQKRGARVLKVHAEYEPFAWWLTRERIGQGLREHYAVSQEMPPRLLARVRQLGDAVEGEAAN